MFNPKWHVVALCDMSCFEIDFYIINNGCLQMHSFAQFSCPVLFVTYIGFWMHPYFPVGKFDVKEIPEVSAFHIIRV